MGTVRKSHPLPRIFKGRQECTGHRGKHGAPRDQRPNKMNHKSSSIQFQSLWEHLKNLLRQRSCLLQVTIFQECEPEFLHDLVLKMRAFIFTPGDLICRKGEVAREMFIIADGLLEVIRSVRQWERFLGILKNGNLVYSFKDMHC